MANGSTALLPSNSLRSGADPSTARNQGKRRTPSELRREQLKRRNTIDLVDDPLAIVADSLKNITQATHGTKKVDPYKTRYTETRMDGIFPSRKPNSRLRLPSSKEHDKVELSNKFRSIKKQFIPPRLTEKSQCLFPCSETYRTLGDSCESAGRSYNAAVPDIVQDAASKEPAADDSTALYSSSDSNLEKFAASADESKGKKAQIWQTVEKCSQNTFCGVAQLSFGCKQQSTPPIIDMDKALKDLIVKRPSVLATDGTPSFGDVLDADGRKFCSEVIVLEKKVPLDLTMKTALWITCSSSVGWVRRLITCASMPQFSQLGDFNDQSITSSAFRVTKANPLHSWVYPQSSLPSSVVSAMASSATGAEMDFLAKRQSAWEDSFRSLYYMFRKNMCKFFYVCTPQFIVMFTIGNAYISRSTRGLRSLLRENDVDYTMPLCKTNVEHVATEDLVELSEIEKHNLGRTRRLDSMHDVDNRPRSLLAFSGNRNVHGLYDLLLNYRYFFTMLSSADVPVLYSTVPFQNAALTAPQARCKEMRKAGAGFPVGSHTQVSEDLSSEFTYSIEIKAAYIPPWVVCNMCAAVGTLGTSFKASFTTEETSVGLNALFSDKCTAGDGSLHPQRDFGIENANFYPSLNSGFLKGVEYKDGSYTASLSWI